MSRGTRYCLDVNLFDDKTIRIENLNGLITFDVDGNGTLLVYEPDSNHPFMAYSNGSWRNVSSYVEEVPDAQEST